MKKTLLTGMVSALLLFSAVPAYADINLTLNNNVIATDTAPVIIDGRTLVPVRAIFENLGAEVGWDNATKTVTATTAEQKIILTLNSATAYVDDVQKTLDVPAQSINGRTMVPVRFVAESLGCEVLWDADTQTVHINTASNTAEPTTEQSTTEQTVDTTGKYVASNDSDKYHYPDCRWAEKILPENLISFDTEEEAVSAGFSPCGTCKP